MEEAPLISILMPVKNAGPWLKTCLNSILAQTENRWELITIDDHSTDQSKQILQQFAAIDTRIRVWKNQGTGIIAALRLALEHSSGDYITRMDADDSMRPEKLHHLVQALLEKGKGWISTGLVTYFSDVGVADGYQRYADWLNRLTLSNNHYSAIYKECVVPSPCWMMHREDLESIEAFQPETYPEDYDLCFRMYTGQLKIHGIDQVLHEWRDHPSRASRTDPNYQDQKFFDLKLKYWWKHEKREDKTLLLWGAGRKGKELAKKIQSRGGQFRWLSDNPNKLSHQIYQIKIEPSAVIASINDLQIIVVISGEEDQKEVREKLNRWKVNPQDVFFFC